MDGIGQEGGHVGPAADPDEGDASRDVVGLPRAIGTLQSHQGKGVARESLAGVGQEIDVEAGPGGIGSGCGCFCFLGCGIFIAAAGVRRRGTFVLLKLSTCSLPRMTLSF